MEEINLDLNNLFNLSYNFEGLKIFLTSIAKNQDLMMGKIKDLEKNSKDNRKKIESMISGEIEIKNNISKNESNLNKEDNIIQNLNQFNETKNKEKYNDFENIINEYNNKQDNSFDSKDNNLLIRELENRIFNLENEFKDLKSFIPVYEKSHTLNDILDEHKISINDMKENINEINNNIGNMKENMEKINLKLGDFSIYDIFKDTNISGDIDAAKLLIKALEKKVFDKFKFEEDKIKKDEEDLLKFKNDLTNLKNSSNFEARNLSYLKEQILKIPKDIEVIRANLSERIMKNKEYIDKVKDKSNTNNKEINININTIKKEIKNLEEKINNKLEELEKNMKKESEEENPSTDRNMVKNEEFQNFKEAILKKCNSLEKKYNSLISNNKLEELDEKIYKLQNELQNKKPNQQDFYNLNELVQGHNDDLENIKNDNSNMEEALRKMKETMSIINKKCEDLILQNLRSNKNIEDSDETKNRQNLFLAKLDDYVETSIFNEFIKEETKVNEKFKKDMESYKQFNDEIIETLKKSASIQDLKNLEDYIVDLFDEFKDKMFKLYPRKSDINKNLKSLELQIKQIYEMIIKKDERTENWMLAKKPIGGFSCASCENYLGDLKENDEKVYWNQLPDHEKDINSNRIGNGFSRILNLVNIKKENKNENNDILLKNEKEKPDYGHIINKEGKNNENNKNIDNEKEKFNVTVYNLNKRKQNIYRNVNFEANTKTAPNLNIQEENNSGYNTQRLRLTATDGGNIFKEIKNKKIENNPTLPPITFKNDENIDIYEEGKDQKNGPKLIKIIKKKK